MNGQYSYPDNRNMTGNTMPMNKAQSTSRNMTTRPMQSDMSRMRTGTGMPSMPTMPAGQNMTDVTLPGIHRTAPMPPRMGTGLTGQTGGLTQTPVVAPESLASRTPTTVESPYYTAGFLKNFIGKNMRVEFLIGTSGALVDRTGVLMEVGASYIVLMPILSDDLLMCDLYSIRFVTIYQ